MYLFKCIICNNMVESGEHDAESNKPGIEILIQRILILKTRI